MLLTSSQVSVAVSSGVVFLCTAALFLSGYAIQQRTLRDLRAAIKPSPRPSPKIFLPDRFQRTTTELDDGTIVAVEEDEAPRRRKQNGGFVVEVKQTVAEPERASGRGGEEAVGAEAVEEPTRTQTGPKGGEEGAGEEKGQKPISRAERRRRIKEEIMKLAQGEERGYYQRRLW